MTESGTKEQDITLTNMTQDEPERVEDITASLRECTQLDWIDSTFAAATMREATDEIERLRTSISVSEKRAEEAERKADRWLAAAIGSLAVINVCTPANAREEFHPENLVSEIKKLGYERDKARDMLARAIARESRLQIERDSSQASLLRVVETLNQGVACGWGYLRLEAEIRTALSPHTEK